MEFYSYLWLREDGTPQYVGKGSGKRAFKQHGFFHPPKDPALILIFPRATEAEAFATEIELIRNWGRLDIGTGCLYNRTPGGEDPPRGCLKGRKLSEAHKLKLAAAKRGKRGNHTGFTHSVETRQKMSKPRSHGWTLTEETKQRQRAAATLREAQKREKKNAKLQWSELG